MTRRRPARQDPLEAAIEVALQPGRFIGYRAGWDFVSSLEEVAGQLEPLVRTDTKRAVGLYETFLAGCYEKAEELDDSSAVSRRSSRASTAAGSGPARRHTLTPTRLRGCCSDAWRTTPTASRPPLNAMP